MLETPCKGSVYIDFREIRPRAGSRSVAATQSAAPVVESGAGFAPIAPLIEAAIARHELPGAVVLVGRGDAIVYHAAFGQRAVQPAPEAMTEDTIFDLASLTKVVATTTSVMQLVEEGRIRLRPVSSLCRSSAATAKAASPSATC